MDIPKANFISNQETEIERLVQTAKQVWSGFYIKKGFVVLPKISRGGILEVILPDIGLEKIGDIETVLREIKLNFPMKTPKLFKAKIGELMVQEKINVSFENEWKKVEADFWQVTRILVPETSNQIEEVEVRITSFGTICSYQFLSKDDKKLIVYIRQDGQIANLAEAILTGLIYPYLGEMGMVWEESEAMVDFVLKNSSLKKYFNEYQPTMKSLREKVSEENKNVSKDYLKQLGIKIEKALEINRNKVELWGKSIDSQLSKKQNLILKMMIENSGMVVTFDEVTKILWSDEEDRFSLWAMNKFVERLRIKLVSLGLSPFVLKTIRGRGVCLEN